jgi:hypothetical protein
MTALSRRQALLGGLTLAADLDGGRSISHRGRQPFAMCSTFKGYASARVLPPGWTTADKTGSGDYASTNGVGEAYDSAGRRILLAMTTRSQVNDPKAQNLRPLIAELTALGDTAISHVGALRGKHPIPRSAPLQYVLLDRRPALTPWAAIEESDGATDVGARDVGDAPQWAGTVRTTGVH